MIKAAPTKIVLSEYAGFDPSNVIAVTPAIGDGEDEVDEVDEGDEGEIPCSPTSPTPSPLKVNERLA